MASSSRGRGGGKGEAEKQGVGGMSTGSGAGQIRVGGVGAIKLRKPSMAVSRPRDRTVVTSGANATQRAIEDAKSVLKAVGKGSSKMLASKRETSLLSMPSAEMSRGIEDAGDGEGVTRTAAFLKRLPSDFAATVAASDDDGGQKLMGSSS